MTCAPLLLRRLRHPGRVAWRLILLLLMLLLLKALIKEGAQACRPGAPPLLLRAPSLQVRILQVPMLHCRTVVFPILL